MTAEIPEPTRRAALRWIPVVAVAVVFLGHDARRLWAPFGPSHDGFNAALYMTGGRAIVEEGPIASRLGAASSTRFGDRVVYAHHPPLIYVASAVAYLLPGPVELRARLPAIVAALTALLCAVLLLSDCGLGPGPAAVGVLFAFATPMFFVFGAMAEPHVLGLAPMAALTLLWQRSRRTEERWMLGAVAAAAALTSWEAGLYAFLVGAALLLERRRSSAAAVLLGTLAGVGLTGLWVFWAYQGNLGEFLGRILHRAGIGEANSVGLLRMVGRQMRYLRGTFPVGGWLVVPVAAIGLLDRRTRAPVALSLGAVLGYALIFKNGASDHSYWLYCLLLPLSLGAAAAAAGVSRWLAGTRPARFAGAWLAGGMVGALAIALAVTLWRPSSDQQQNEIGAALGAQARAVEWPQDQRNAYHTFGGRGTTDLLPWLRFYAEREPIGVEGPDSVPRGQLMLRLVGSRLDVAPGELGPPQTAP